MSENRDRTPAEKCGLRKGDVIARVGGHAVRGGLHLVYLLALYSPSDEVTLDVRRGNKQLTLGVTLASREEELTRQR